jgi:hypothetical protein
MLRIMGFFGEMGTLSFFLICLSYQLSHGCTRFGSFFFFCS